MHCFFSAITAPPGTHAHPENLGRDDHEDALEAQNEAVENSQLSLGSRWWVRSWDKATSSICHIKIFPTTLVFHDLWHKNILFWNVVLKNMLRSELHELSDPIGSTNWETRFLWSTSIQFKIVLFHLKKNTSTFCSTTRSLRSDDHWTTFWLNLAFLNALRKHKQNLKRTSKVRPMPPGVVIITSLTKIRTHAHAYTYSLMSIYTDADVYRYIHTNTYTFYVCACVCTLTETYRQPKI